MTIPPDRWAPIRCCDGCVKGLCDHCEGGGSLFTRELRVYVVLMSGGRLKNEALGEPSSQVVSSTALQNGRGFNS